MMRMNYMYIFLGVGELENLDVVGLVDIRRKVDAISFIMF